ncbi:MAG: hypothetical protein O2887_09765 [Bacteroidetes bacterium]|nr:hypothetical protein [Bacteroidota bacterium]MDA1120758.1 hypothetical protein [Bacteroidota bacterium]
MRKLLLLLSLLSSVAYAQQLQPKGMFLADSIRLGEVIPYQLAFSYPIDMEVLFPDSTHDFSPFEFTRKEFYPTNVDSTLATDRVVYYLSTFETDLVQHLNLPVYLLTNGDSTVVLGMADSVNLIEMIPIMPDSVALMEDVKYLKVNQAFNYPYLIIGLSIAFILLIGSYLAFGKQVQKKIRLYRMKKAYIKFNEDYVSVFGEIRKGDKSKTETLLILWKNYLEKLEDRPYTKLTSKEISNLSDAKSFSKALKTIDRAIYGKLDSGEILKNFESLEDITVERYNKKVIEIKNG